MESRKRRLLCRTAEVALIVFVALAVPGLASAGDGYITNTQTGQSIIPGATDIGNHCDDCVTPLALPFPVPVYSTPYSSAYVSSNGNIQFLTANGGAPSIACMPLAINGFDRAFIPYLGDLRTDETGGGIFTAVLGSPPNRQFVIEWRTTYFQRAGLGELRGRLDGGLGHPLGHLRREHRQRLDGDERDPVRGPGAVHAVLLRRVDARHRACA